RYTGVSCNVASGHLGDWGEALAARHLQSKGWTILARKFRDGHKEIDLVARRGGGVAFVEGKNRGTKRFGHPFEAVGARKRREIEAVAESWIRQYGDSSLTYRFDAIAVLSSSSRAPAIEHLEDAWGI